jgi:gamma-glutamyl-gamma-aminobutyrate hydrolase PuuD
MLNLVFNNSGDFMFESIEIRRVANGFVVTVQLEDETVEYVFDTARKAMSHNQLYPRIHVKNSSNYRRRRFHRTSRNR